MPDMPDNSSPGRTWWLSAAVAAFIALAWTGILDHKSTDYLDGALLTSGAIYATARGINAIVSVLQGTEMNAFIITFTVGELLDPVNDLIERFSGVMMMAIGSLALQKILLEVVSHHTFNILLTLLGAGAIGTQLLHLPGPNRTLTKFLIVTVVIRFSLALVVLANSWADRIFLAENEAQRVDAMKVFHGELELIGSRAGLNIDLDDDMKTVEADILRNREAQDFESKNLRSNERNLARAVAELAALDHRSIWEWLTGDTPADIEVKQSEIRRLESTISENEHTLAALSERREALQDRLACLKQRASGNSCSLADSMSSALAAVDVKRRIEALGDKVDEFASNLINLLMSLILKSILLPLLFIYLLLHFVKSSFTRPG